MSNEVKKMILVFVFLVLCNSQYLGAKDNDVMSLNYISPSELIESLSLDEQSSEGYLLTLDSAKVRLRFNHSNNHVMLMGSFSAINSAKELIAFLDVPPRQVIIEVKIIEMNNQKLNEIGLDWQNLLDKTNVPINYNREQTTRDEKTTYEDQSDLDRKTEFTNISERISGQTSINAGDLLKIVQESNIGTITNVPRIVTTNNKKGTLLDGDRITYVTRYSSFTNLFETQELSAGLSLEVTPSLGKSGYLKLDVKAKFTSLGQIIADSPSESGQILENTVIVKDKEPFLLGAFKQTETRKIKRKVPILGAILPFLFSRNVDINITRDVLLILTPEVIDLNTVEIPKI